MAPCGDAPRGWTSGNFVEHGLPAGGWVGIRRSTVEDVDGARVDGPVVGDNVACAGLGTGRSRR